MTTKELESSWGDRFAKVGWQPSNYMSIASSILENNSTDERILGLLHTGDEIGELLEVRVAHINNEQYEVKTIVGFTTGEWYERGLIPNHIIEPENRIPGYLVITSKRFFAKGFGTYEMAFKDTGVPSDNPNSIKGAKWNMEKRGNKRYKFQGDISASYVEFDGPNPMQRYDQLLIALVTLRSSFLGGIDRLTFDTWSDFLHAIKWGG
jgi:hypothetical protein